MNEDIKYNNYSIDKALIVEAFSRNRPTSAEGSPDNKRKLDSKLLKFDNKGIE
jgi:hypothetical protein